MVGSCRNHCRVLREHRQCAFLGANSDLSYSRGRSGVWEQLDFNQCYDSTCHICLFSFFIFVSACSLETGSLSVILANSLCRPGWLWLLGVFPSASGMLRVQEWATSAWIIPRLNFSDKEKIWDLTMLPGAGLNSWTKLSFCLSSLSTRYLGVHYCAQ